MAKGVVRVIACCSALLENAPDKDQGEEVTELLRKGGEDLPAALRLKLEAARDAADAVGGDQKSQKRKTR